MLLRKKEINPVEKKIVDNLRALSIDMIREANSGHPGIALGSAPILASVYLNHLKYDINNPNWINRDRFVMSAGHGSSLLYATLFMAGYDITIDDLKQFRKIDSNTPGHPEINVTPGVDISTGPLGQGVANAVGMAIAEQYLNKLFPNKLIDYNTYCLVGDGCLMEGISYEALSLAGKLNLNKLIVLYDSNNVTLDGDLLNSSNESVKQRFEAINFNYILVNDSEDIISLNDAICKAKTSDKPTLIEVKTTIGKYSINEGTCKVHGSVLDDNDIKQIKEKMNMSDIPFQVFNDCLDYFKDISNSRNEMAISNWMKKVTELDEENKNLLDLLLSNEGFTLKDVFYNPPIGEKEATRVTSGKIIDSISKVYPLFIGGSCDVSKSTFAKIDDENKYINYGIRELASAAISNGIASCNLIPFTSTFLSFSDYMKPAIRMSAMMNLPVIYIFSHDTITVGEDGPTHQPVEQLISLRSIPNLDVYRPCDANEVLGTYKTIFEKRKPACIILGRNKVDLLENTKANNVHKGAYLIKEYSNSDATIISSGEEINLALDVSNKLEEKGIKVNVVSMVSIELFEQMDDKYKKSILSSKENVFVIEASSSYSWYKYVIDDNHLFTMNTFGSSGNYKDVLNKYNFECDYIGSKIEKTIK